MGARADYVKKHLRRLSKKQGRANEVFRTKMRSVINQANRYGIAANVAQQFELGAQILAADLVPILKPEIDIHCPTRRANQLRRPLEPRSKAPLSDYTDRKNRVSSVRGKIVSCWDDPNHYSSQCNASALESPPSTAGEN